MTDRNRQAYLNIARRVLARAAQELARTGRPVALKRAALAMAAIHPVSRCTPGGVGKGQQYLTSPGAPH
jgi:hypothetical protein